MKGFVVYKMCFIFIYFLVIMLNIENEVSNPCWISFIRGSATTFYLFALIRDVIAIVKKK